MYVSSVYNCKMVIFSADAHVIYLVQDLCSAIRIFSKSDDQVKWRGDTHSAEFDGTTSAVMTTDCCALKTC